MTNQTGEQEANNGRRAYWAKFSEETGNIHRLEHHLADVGAVMQVLLSIPSISKATARSGNLSELRSSDAARLCVFAALHDMGKVNLGFQAKSKPRRERGRTASHTQDVMQLLNQRDPKGEEHLMTAVEWLNEALTTWDRNDGATVCGLIIAALSHHGTPENLHNGHEPRPEHWKNQSGEYEAEPFEKMREIALSVREWFPDAFHEDARPLPKNPDFQHQFLGLLMLADWIGSDTRWFKFQPEPDKSYYRNTALPQARKAVGAIGLDTRKQPIPNHPATLAEIAGKPNAEANAIQKAVTETDLNEKVIVIESETGSGKTEAALLRFQRMRRAGLVDGVYFALPIRAAATQIHHRVTQAIRRIMPEAKVEPVLAIPGYIKAGEQEGTPLPEYRVHWEDHPDEGTRWAAESAKKFLTAQVAVGTVDQAMLSVMQTKHAHMRAACLSRNLLVIDEVHASDTYMHGIMQELVRNHTMRGGYTLLMSATLGSSARSAYLGKSQPSLDESKNLKHFPYPCISTVSATTGTGDNGQPKEVRITMMPLEQTHQQVAKEALRAQQAGAKVLVIRNTTRLASETVQALEAITHWQPDDALLTVNGVPAPHHSRFAAEDRKLLDAAAERSLSAENPGKGIVVTGTQTLEQSLDIDADYLITDLCPMDVLLQRIGRLHRRHGRERPEEYSTAQCTVIMPTQETADLMRKTSATGLGPRGHVYVDLRVIEATRRRIEDGQVWKIPEMNRELVEDSTHSERLKEIVDDNPGQWTEHHNAMRVQASADRMASRTS
ncbi:MAG: CRISPR-associated helicase Cas3' [Chloroflexota bacterium]|nr:CRISPR-associated helicase Cas3' [Chloroflexota bacterium]